MNDVNPVISWNKQFVIAAELTFKERLNIFERYNMDTGFRCF